MVERGQAQERRHAPRLSRRMLRLFAVIAEGILQQGPKKPA